MKDFIAGYTAGIFTVLIIGYLFCECRITTDLIIRGGGV